MAKITSLTEDWDIHTGDEIEEFIKEQFAGVGTDIATEKANLLQRIQGRADASSAHTDPILYLGEWSNTTSADGTTVYATDLFDSDFEQMLCSSVTKYLGRNRATVWGRNVDLWCYYVGNTEVTEGGNEYDIKTFALALDSMYNAVNGYLRFDATYSMSKANRCYRTVKIRYPKGVFTGGTVVDVTGWEDDNQTVRLGAFTSYDEFLAKAKSITYIQDFRVYLLVGYIYNQGRYSNVLIIQDVKYNGSNFVTIQKVFYEGNIKERKITSTPEGGITNITALSSVYGRNLTMGPLKYLKLTDINDNQVGSSVDMRGNDQSALREESSTTSNVRLVQTKTFGNTNEVLLTPATSAKAGVMTAEMYNKVQSLETNQTNLSTRVTSVENKQTTDSARITSEVTARITADTKLLQRIQGRSSESRSLDDPFIWLGEFNDTITDGAVTESGTEAFGQYAMDMLLNNDYLKYVGHGRAMVTGTNQDIWTYFMGTRTAEYTDGTYELKFFAQKTRGRYGANALGNLALSDDHDLLEAERKVTVKRFVDGSPAVIESVTAWGDSGATVKDLGVFNSTSDVMAAAAKVGIVRDYRIAMMVARLNTSNNSHKSSIVINQQITANSDGTYTTWQYIFEKNQRYTRNIQSNATAVTSVQSVQKDGVRNLEYGQLGYLKLTDMHGSQIGASVHMKGIDQSALREENSTTENVQLVQSKTFGGTNNVSISSATSAKAGVMTSEMYTRLETLWNLLNVGEPQEKSANEGVMSIASTSGMSPGSIVELIHTSPSVTSNLSAPIQLEVGDKISISTYAALLQEMTDTSAKVLAYSSGIEYTATQAMVVYIYSGVFPISYTHKPGSILTALEARIAALEAK